LPALLVSQFVHMINWFETRSVMWLLHFNDSSLFLFLSKFLYSLLQSACLSKCFLKCFCYNWGLIALMLQCVCWVNLSDQITNFTCLALKSWPQCGSLHMDSSWSAQWLWNGMIGISIWGRILGTNALIVLHSYNKCFLILHQCQILCHKKHLGHCLPHHSNYFLQCWCLQE